MTTVKTHVSKDAQFHIQKAERNEAFYQKYNMHTFDASSYNEWAAVVLFYAAMHYIDAILSKDTFLSDSFRDPDDHQTRKKAVARCREVSRPIKRDYYDLFDRSLDARYKKICFPNDFIRNLVKDQYNPLKNYCRNYLKLP